MASFFKKALRSLGGMSTGILGGFLTGGPMGAVVGGATGALRQKPLTFRSALSNFGLGALGGLGTAAFGKILSMVPGGMGNIGEMIGLGKEYGLGGGTPGATPIRGSMESNVAEPEGGTKLGNIARSVLGTGQGMFGTSVNPLQLAQGILGFQGARQQAQRTSGIQDVQMGLLGQGKELAGLSPEARRLMLEKVKEQIRASQAERGIYQSGPSAAFEAEQLPLIEAQMNQMALENLLRTSQGYSNLYGGGGYQ